MMLRSSLEVLEFCFIQLNIITHLLIARSTQQKLGCHEKLESFNRYHVRTQSSTEPVGSLRTHN